MKLSIKTGIAYGIGIVFVIALLAAHYFNIPLGQRIGAKCISFTKEMVILVPCIFLIIGLIDEWIPDSWIKKHIGEKSGLRGSFFIILLAVFQGGPLYGAFPTAHLLWKKGCSMKNVFMYLGAFSALKIPMLFFEVSYLGWKFTLVRAAIAVPIFILIALIMTEYTRKMGIEFKTIEKDKTGTMDNHKEGSR